MHRFSRQGLSYQWLLQINQGYCNHLTQAPYIASIKVLLRDTKSLAPNLKAPLCFQGAYMATVKYAYLSPLIYNATVFFKLT